MSLKVQPLPPIPQETQQVVHQILPVTNIFRIIGERLSNFVSDEDFADLYPTEGRPALSPALLAMVTVFQFLENLSDRQAVMMVVSRLDWKYALHLPLAYAGFDPSVLCEFRVRLMAQKAEARVFNQLLSTLKDQGLLQGRHLQRTDSLAVLSAVRQLSRLELAMETLRLALNAVESTDTVWLRNAVPHSWAERYGTWTQHGRLVRAKGEAARIETARLLAQTGEDGQWLLEKVDQAATPPVLRALPEVDILRRVWQQQFVVLEQRVTVRDKVDACGADLIQTPHDPQVRYGEHGGQSWQGYQVHLTETAEPTQPRIITDVQTTPAGQADCRQIAPIQKALTERDLLPETHVADGGYVNGDTLGQSSQRGVKLMGPVQADTSPQAQRPDGLTADQFVFDYEQQVAQCPGGQTSRTWSVRQNQYGATIFDIHFAAAGCQSCDLKRRCMPTKQIITQGRALKIKPSHEQVKQRRQEQQTQTFKEVYRRRAGIEASLSEMIRAHGLRRARYCGRPKIHLQHLWIATATNLKRAARWLAGCRPIAERKPGLRLLSGTT